MNKMLSLQKYQYKSENITFKLKLFQNEKIKNKMILIYANILF